MKKFAAGSFLRLVSAALPFFITALTLPNICSMAFAEGRIAEIWTNARRSVIADNLTAANQQLLEIQDLQVAEGITDSPEISAELAGLAAAAWASGQTEKAEFLIRKAMDLSPHDPELMVSNSQLIVATGTNSSLDLTKRIFKASLARYDILFNAIVKTIYPVLWAVTLTALISAFLFFVCHMHILLSRIERLIPLKAGTPLISLLTVAFVIVLPLASGPVWSLIIYSLILYCYFPAQKVFAACCSLVLLCWVLVVPIKENWQLWLGQKEVAVMLRNASGTFFEGDQQKLANLIKERPFDGAALLAHAKIERRYGNYSEALKTLATAEGYITDRSTVDAERAINYFLLGDTDKAADIAKQLESQGMNSAEFLFNYSKISFDLLDTESSRKLYERANSKNYALMQEMKAREDKLGFRNRLSFAETGIPLSDILRSSLLKNERATLSSDRVYATISPWLGPLYIGVAGMILLLAVPFVSSRQKREGSRSPYCGIDALCRVINLLPGGSALVSGKAMRAFCSVCFVVLLALPLMGWPNGAGAVLRQLAGLELYYTFVFCFVFSALCYISFSAGKEES